MKVLQTLVWDGKEAGTIGTGTSVDPGEALINKTKVQLACSALSLPPAGNLGRPTHEHKRWQQVRAVLAPVTEGVTVPRYSHILSWHRGWVGSLTTEQH